MRIELQPAFILHSRPFSDTSLIVECLTPDFGRISLLAKGARSAKSKQRSLLQPFIPLSVSWQGKSSLKTLTSVEARALPLPIEGKGLYSGFYLNELLVRLLPEQDAHPEVLQVYQHALDSLVELQRTDTLTQQSLQVVLRFFELQLLQLLGYEINFAYEAMSTKPIIASSFYRFDTARGFVRVIVGQNQSLGVDVFFGQHILAVATQDYLQPYVLGAAKRLMRQALKPLLGHKPLQSRKLFEDMVGPAGEPLLKVYERDVS